MSSESVFTIGDVVLANPKESASLLSVVILLAVGAQYLFRALRKSKTAAVRMVFGSFSNSLLTIGAISLVFSFASQAVGGINERWLLLLRWSQVVLLTLLLQLFGGTIIGTTLLQKIWTIFETTETKIPSSTYSQATTATSGSSMERSFVDKYTSILHIVFVKDVAFMVQSLAAAAAAAAEGRRRLSSRRDALRRKLGAMLVHARERDELELQSTGTRLPDGTLKSEQAAGAGESGANNGDLEATLLGQTPKQMTTPLLLSSILQNALHTQMSDIADITWQSWLMLIFLVGANSVRMFALPGKLQSKPVSEFTLDDRTLNILTFIGLVGWLPTAVFLIVLGLVVRNFRNYTVMADSVLTLTKDVDTMGPALEAGRVKVTSGAVWLPPEPRDYERHRSQFQGNHNNNGAADSDDDDYDDPSSQHQLEDPSMYFLRGNRSFTLHALRVPMLMVELYSAIFFIGMIGDVTATFGPRLVYVLPVALLPLLIVWFTVPIGAFILACLSSMGSRLGEDDLAEAFLSSGEWRELLGDEVALDEAGVDNEYGKDPNDNDNNACIYCEERINEIRDLEEKIDSLERLCRKFGLKTGEYRGSAKHSHHQDIDLHASASAPSASAFDTHFNSPPTSATHNKGSGASNNKNGKKDFFWPASFSEAGSVQESHNDDDDFVEMNNAASTNKQQQGFGSNNTPRTYVAPDNVQAASFQDNRQRDLARSFQADKQLQKQLLGTTQQQNSNFASPSSVVNNRRASVDTGSHYNNQQTPRTFSNTTPRSTAAGSQQQQQQQNYNNGNGRVNIPLLSSSAIASPSAATNRSAVTPRNGTTPRNTMNNNSNASFAVQSPSNNLRQSNHGDVMMKNVNNALRGVL